jgi:hypothetical protein
MLAILSPGAVLAHASSSSYPSSPPEIQRRRSAIPSDPKNAAQLVVVRGGGRSLRSHVFCGVAAALDRRRAWWRKSEGTAVEQTQGTCEEKAALHALLSINPASLLLTELLDFLRLFVIDPRNAVTRATLHLEKLVDLGLQRLRVAVLRALNEERHQPSG